MTRVYWLAVNKNKQQTTESKNMAFQKVASGKGGKAETIKPGFKLEAYLVGFHSFEKKFGKEVRRNFVYEFTDAKGGNKREVWGNGQLNQIILDEDRNAIQPFLLGHLVQIVGGKKVKIKGRALPMQSVDLLVDPDKSISVKRVSSGKIDFKKMLKKSK